jgi:hemerythrin-like domain-containing protein
MDLIDFRLPASGFESPLLLWLACHERGQRVAQLLLRLTEHWTAHGPSDAINVTARDVRRYFDEAAPRHQQDEDLDLFPRLMRRLDLSGAAGGERLADVLQRLDGEHREMDRLWPAVRDAIEHCATRMIHPDHPGLLQRFVGAFIGHHDAENAIILPTAQLALQPVDLAEIGDSMAARRGTTWAALSGKS